MAFNRNYKSKNPCFSQAARQESHITEEEQKIQRYTAQINQCQSQIDDISSEIARLQREIGRLEEFRVNRMRAWGEFQSEHAARQIRIQGVEELQEKCLSGKVYCAGMSEEVNGNSMLQVITSVEHTFKMTDDEIQKREERVEELKKQIGTLEGQISNLYQMIAYI